MSLDDLRYKDKNGNIDYDKSPSIGFWPKQRKTNDGKSFTVYVGPTVELEGKKWFTQLRNVQGSPYRKENSPAYVLDFKEVPADYVPKKAPANAGSIPSISDDDLPF